MPAQNLVALWEDSVDRFADNPLFGVRESPEAFGWITYRQVADRVDALRAGLAGVGVQRGDAVGIIANNRPEWAIAAFATYGLGARFVPMYEAELPKVWRYIIADADVRVLLVANAEIAEALADLPVRIVVIDAEGDGSMAALESAGRPAPVPSIQPEVDDIAVLIYTSGTTGDPKGVLLSHGNLTSNVEAGHQLFDFLDETHTSLAILPWAHSYGQTGELYNFIQLGAAIGIAGGPQTLAADMLTVRPTFLISVPRIFSRIHDAVWAKVRDEGGVKLRLFEAAIRAARQRRERGHGGLRFWLLDRLVLAKVRAKMGGRLLGSLSGSAQMNPQIAEFFLDLGVPVYDCYGLTETSPAATMNAPGAHRLGSVGRAIPGVRVSIDTSCVHDGSGEGEIIIHGPNVMKGYHNKPEATAAVLTEDGGLRTGDRGRVDEDGYLYITGRFKEQYKLENGKFVFPAAIEEEIKRLPYVLNAMVFGNGRPHNECLIVPDPEQLTRALGAAAAHLADDDDSGRAARARLAELITSHLDGSFGSYEIPRQYHLIDEDFTVANGMLTHTLKLKRRVIEQRYAAIIAPSA